MVMIIGHRGARDLWPENSLLGFRKTLELGPEQVGEHDPVDICVMTAANQPLPGTMAVRCDCAP